MTCMCGDSECSSCGTAQGTYTGNLHQSVLEAIENGFTHVRTYAGPVPLEEWRPYGKRPEDCKSIILAFDAGNGIKGDRYGPSIREIPRDQKYRSGMGYGIWLLE